MLDAAVDATGAERDDLVARLCANDIELRREVESLLQFEDRVEVFERAPGPSFSAPEQVGPYRIERVIASGGMGTVYLASRADDQYRKHVAVKVVQSGGNRSLVRRFRTERQILASLEHPYIARLLDGGVLDDGRPYLVMEYVAGRRIDEYVDARRLPLREVLELFVKVCSAVQFAHQNMVLHRDLKPGNVLVTEDGEPRLLDFGIAKLLGGDLESTQPFDRLLTPSSASPEQIAGAPVTTATDVYSLGVMLYRLLTGKTPYAAARDSNANPAAIFLTYEIPAASAVMTEERRSAALRGDLDNILRKALEKEPSRRYATVDEFAGDIRRYLEGRPVQARPASLAYRAGKFVRRNRALVTASALLACAILSGVAGTLWYARRAQAETAIAQRRFEALRKLSESLVFDLHDAIEKLPGATNARALVVRRALTYLNQLEADAEGNKAVQRDLASAYMRIGDIEGSERGPHLGGADALRSAAECYTKALNLRRTLAAADPNDEAAQRDLFASMWKVAEVYRRQGDLDQALQLSLDRLNRIRALRTRRTSTDLDYSLAVSLTVIGDLYRIMGQYDLASRYARDALEVRQRILSRNPGDPRARRSVGLAYEFIAYPLTAQRKYAEAAAAHKTALSFFEPLASAAPLDTDLARLVEVGHANLCEALSRTGQIAEALPHCQAAIEISQRMLKADPVNIQAAEDVAASSWSMGVMLESAGRLAEALRWERKSIALYETAVARDPDSVETVTGYADALIEAAGIGGRLRDPGACEHIAQATAVLARLRGISPKNAEVQVREEQARSLTLRFQHCPAS